MVGLIGWVCILGTRVWGELGRVVHDYVTPLAGKQVL
jgi:hypothetical protein